MDAQIYSLISVLSASYAMPQALTARSFASKVEQMRLWMSDPILRPEAVLWFTHFGWTPIIDDYGCPIDFLPPGKEDQEPQF